MNKVLFTLSFLLASVFSFNVIAQEVGATPKNGPVIEIDKEVHDYGTIEKGADPYCYFTITNTGNQPLVISNCKGSCGCTTPECPKEPIAPGTSAKLKVKYDTQRVGPINKQVTITSNAVNSNNFTNGQGKTIIKIKGNIKPPASGSSTTN